MVILVRPFCTFLKNQLIMVIVWILRYSSSVYTTMDSQKK